HLLNIGVVVGDQDAGHGSPLAAQYQRLPLSPYLLQHPGRERSTESRYSGASVVSRGSKRNELLQTLLLLAGGLALGITLGRRWLGVRLGGAVGRGRRRRLRGGRLALRGRLR